jgi:predicted dehydrogenase
MTSPSKKRVVIVGAGRFGRHYINRASHHEDFELVGVVDANASALRSIQAEGIAVAATLDPALEFVPHDAVVICTDADSHVTLAMQALASGKHVLVAKPGVTTIEEYEQVSALADEKNVDWSVDYTMMGAPEVNFLDISFCAYGEPFFMEARRFVHGEREAVGEVFGLMVHDVALLDYHLPSSKQVTRVSAWESGSMIMATLHSNESEVGSLMAGYGFGRQTQLVEFCLTPHGKIKNPITEITWDQSSRIIDFYADWRHKYDVRFETTPDPITISLDRFRRRIQNKDEDADHLTNALFYSTHQGHQPTRRITSILTAIQKSLDSGEEEAVE